MDALQFEAVKVALKQDATGYVLTLKMHPDEIPNELLRDFVGARYMVAMARLNDDESLVRYVNRVKRAGIMCRDPKFQEWLETLAFDGTKHTEISATTFIHTTCNIKSRTELNGNKSAQLEFDRLTKDFEEWRNNDEPF